MFTSNNCVSKGIFFNFMGKTIVLCYFDKPYDILGTFVSSNSDYRANREKIPFIVLIVIFIFIVRFLQSEQIHSLGDPLKVVSPGLKTNTHKAELPSTVDIFNACASFLDVCNSSSDISLMQYRVVVESAYFSFKASTISVALMKVRPAAAILLIVTFTVPPT